MAARRPSLIAPAAAAAAAVLMVLAGCAAPPAAPPAAPQLAVEPPLAASEVLARSDELLVVVPRAGDDFAALARRYLGDARKAWWISEFNRIARPTPGVDLVIPLKPARLNSVDARGVRTITILCYHRFDNGKGKLSTNGEDFAAQMEVLAQDGYHVVALRDLPAILRGEQPMPPKAVAITIDDGYRSTFDVAYPVLVKYGFRATVFLYSDFAGLPAALTWAQMREMTASGLIDIQPHSKSHANLSLRLPDESERAYLDRIAREIDAPAAELKRRLEVPTYAFAYPYGDANESVTELMEKRGVQLAFTVTPGSNAFFAYPLLLRRTMIFGEDTVDDFRAKLTGANREPVREPGRENLRAPARESSR
jgi:peptidoglycan/xylan/chitin deacetylase (PgdA/CDA1 family)